MSIGALPFVAAVVCGIWLAGRLIQVVDANTEHHLPLLNSVERAFAAFLVLILATSWFGLVLAELGRFSLATLTLMLLVADLSMAAGLRLARVHLWQRPELHVDHYGLAALVLVILLGILYAHPGEWIAGGSDPGSYVSIGVHIARKGSILIRDDALARVPPDDREVLLNQPVVNPARDGDRFPAFYIRDLNNPVITPQFFHVFPVWIAIFYGLGGLQSALYATPFFGLLSCFAVYLLGRRLAHPVVGLLAMLLLGLNISQLWFARNPFADIVLQFFLFSGFWSAALLGSSLERQGPGKLAAAVLAGTCLGMSHLVKLDVFIVPPVLVALFGFLWVTGRWDRAFWAFLVPYLLLCAHMVLHAYFFAWPYVYDVFSYFAEYTRAIPFAAAAALLMVGLVLWQRDRIATWVAGLLRHRGHLEQVFTVGILFLSLYAYYVRPLRADLGAMSYSEIASRGPTIERLRFMATEPQMVQLPQEVRSYVEAGIVRVGWFLSPLGIWLGVAGFLVWARAKLSVGSSTFLGASLVSALMFFYRGAIVPYFYWAFKRFIPVVVPSFALFIAFILWELWQAGRDRPYLRLLPTLLASVLLISYVQGSIMVWQHIEYEGAIADIASVASSLPQHGVTLFRRSDESNRLGVPLTYIFDRDVFPVAEEYETDLRLRTLVATWLRESIPVHWITPACEPLSGYYPQHLTRRVDILWPEVPYTLTKLPDHIAAFSSQLCVYEVLGTDRVPRIPDDVNVEFGDSITLLGHELSPDQIRPGEDMHLSLYWQALQAVGTDYTVFVHLLDDDGEIVTQMDHIPAYGSPSTTSWVPGEVVVDEVLIPVPFGMKPARYALRVGLYEYRSMQRLQVSNDEGAIVGDQVSLGDVIIYQPVDQ